MRPKTLNPSKIIILDEMTTIKINPGPGAYEKIETITNVSNMLKLVKIRLNSYTFTYFLNCLFKISALQKYVSF